MDWKKLVSKFGGKMTREKWLFLLLLGVILMILSMPFPGSSSKKTGQTKGENVSLWEKNSSGDGQQTEENIVQEPVQAASAKPAQDYEKELEDRISQLLKSVEGVGKVDVMVVLSSSGEKVFRTDRSENTSTTKEKDASGGERDARGESIWETNIFGKSIEQLVQDGIRSKLTMISEESQVKLQDTMQKIVNDSKGGLVCIII